MFPQLFPWQGRTSMTHMSHMRGQTTYAYLTTYCKSKKMQLCRSTKSYMSFWQGGMGGWWRIPTWRCRLFSQVNGNRKLPLTILLSTVVKFIREDKTGGPHGVEMLVFTSVYQFLSLFPSFLVSFFSLRSSSLTFGSSSFSCFTVCLSYPDFFPL